NFYMLGSMGLAVPIALGVAIAQPNRHVVALEGDGSLLMQLGCLATVAMLKPKNLTIVVMDNGIYQITAASRRPPPPSPTSPPPRAAPPSSGGRGPPTRRTSTACLQMRSPAGRR